MLSKTNINMNFQTFSHNIPLLRKESFFFLPVYLPILECGTTSISLKSVHVFKVLLKKTYLFIAK